MHIPLDIALGLVLLTLVHWLLGYAFARFLMFVAMMCVAWCLAVADIKLSNASFFLPDLVVLGLLAWWLSGIPRRYRKRSDAKGWNFDERQANFERACREMQQDRLVDERLAELALMKRFP